MQFATVGQDLTTVNFFGLSMEKYPSANSIATNYLLPEASYQSQMEMALVSVLEIPWHFAFLPMCLCQLEVAMAV